MGVLKGNKLLQFFLFIIFTHSKFSYEKHTPNTERIKALLQDVTVHVSVNRINAQDHLPSEELVVPHELPLNMLVILRPGIMKEVYETFWLGNIKLMYLCYLYF